MIETRYGATNKNTRWNMTEHPEEKRLRNMVLLDKKRHQTVESLRVGE